MDREAAKTHIKKQLPAYLSAKGINHRKPFNCLNPEHPDHHPSMSYDRKRNKVHCFSCQVDYDIFDLIGLDYGLHESAEIFKKAHQLYNITLDSRQTSTKSNKQKTFEATQHINLEAYFAQCHAKVSLTDYFKQREIGNKAIKKFNLGYDTTFSANSQKWHAIIIPTGRNSFVARNTNKHASEKDRFRKFGSSEIFNKSVLAIDQTVFVVEGEFDALSVIECGFNAVALGSTANKSRFIELAKQGNVKSQIILSLDNDEAGKNTENEVAQALEQLEIPFLQANISGEHKDPNDALIKNREGFIKALSLAQQTLKENAAQKEEERKSNYLNTSAAHYVADFVDDVFSNVDTPCIPTGFSGLTSLDTSLDGGLYEGLYIFGAISSLGKTTFVLQIADQVASSGQDVVIFSLEMSRYELMAKSISRETFIHASEPSCAITTRGITDGKRYESYPKERLTLINTSINAYQTYASNLYIHEGVGDVAASDIRKMIAQHVQCLGKKPVVVVDYLQLLAPEAGNERATDKQNTDKAVLELKRISRDYKIPVLAISSFNRYNYKNPVTMEAFKESGAIEYSSDVLIGLQLAGCGKTDFDVDEAKRKNPREVEVKILKNRNGRTGDSIPFEYLPAYNYFQLGDK